jgi:glycosyltransferase involved in cell wall biosynthesis
MNAINHTIKEALDYPSLPHIYALEVDRQLRAMGKDPMSFSALGVAGYSRGMAAELGLESILKSNAGSGSVNAIYHAEMLASAGQRSEALAHAFTHAQGKQIDGLNLLYANYATEQPALRLLYLNKYLKAHGLQVELAQDDSLPFFNRLRCDAASSKVDGPLVTVIMAAHNAERTIELALSSLLNQTWQNLQIIVVDDASTDGTLLKAKGLAKRDARVEVLRSPVNVGPYVCRNLGVLHTRGELLTVHDADDWAFPDRIEQQVKALTEYKALTCTGRMLRMNEQGQITRPVADSSVAEDGYLRLCFVSLMVRTDYFRKELGAWDSVRVGGDAELIERLKSLGTPKKHLRRPLMLCLDHDASLTNHKLFGLNEETGRARKLRAEYKRTFTAWHVTKGVKKLSVFGRTMPIEGPRDNRVDESHIKKVFNSWNKNLEIIRNSEHFDAAWYKGRHPEIEQMGLEAAEHYLLYGSQNKLLPNNNLTLNFTTHYQIKETLWFIFIEVIIKNSKITEFCFRLQKWLKMETIKVPSLLLIRTYQIS